MSVSGIPAMTIDGFTLTKCDLFLLPLIVAAANVLDFWFLPVEEVKLRDVFFLGMVGLNWPGRGWLLSAFELDQ